MSGTQRGFDLHGCDAFMVAMDHAMRTVGSVGNICHLLVTLAEGAPLKDIAASMCELPLMQYLTRLTMQRSLAGRLRWKLHARAPMPCCDTWDVVTTRELEDAIVRHRRDPRRDPPFGVIVLPRYEQGPSLLFYWYHGLCDARGGEQIVRLLAEEYAGDVVLPSTRPRESWRETVRRAGTMKRTIFHKAAPPIARFPSRRSDPARQRYAKIRFTTEETRAIETLVQRFTAGIFPMALHLGATIRALPPNIQGPIFIPVPHDMRRVTRDRSPLSNQVSMVFFRLTAGSDETLAVTTNHIIAQLYDAIAEEQPQNMLSFLRLLHRVPSGLLWRIIEKPAAGHPASLYFSDIGNSLSHVSTVYGIPVTYATHYPPHLSPPGFTTVWSHYRNALEVTVCYDQEAVSEDMCEEFCLRLREQLLQG